MYNMLLWTLQVTVPVLYLIKRSQQPWSTFGLARPRLVLDTLAALGIWLVGSFLYYVLWYPFDRFFGPDKAGLWYSFSLPSGVSEYLVLIVFCCANGFSEELVMRGYLLPRLEQWLGSTTQSLLVTTVLFAAYHIYQGPTGVFGTLVLGLVYGAAFCLLRRLWPLALAHALQDYLGYTAYAG